MPVRTSDTLNRLESTSPQQAEPSAQVLGSTQKLVTPFFRLFAPPASQAGPLPQQPAVFSEPQITLDEEIQYFLNDVRLIEKKLQEVLPHFDETLTSFIDGENEEPAFDDRPGTRHPQLALMAYIHVIKSMNNYYKARDKYIINKKNAQTRTGYFGLPESYEPHLYVITVFRHLMRRHIVLEFLRWRCQTSEPAYHPSRLKDRFAGVENTLASSKYIDEMIEQDLEALSLHGEVYCVGGYAPFRYRHSLSGHVAYFKIFKDHHGDYYRVDYNAGDETSVTSIDQFDDAAYSVDARRITIPENETIQVEEVIRRMLIVAYERNLREPTLTQHIQLRAEQVELYNHYCGKSNRSQRYSQKTFLQRKGNCASRSLRELLRGNLGAGEFDLLECFVQDKGHLMMKRPPHGLDDVSRIERKWISDVNDSVSEDDPTGSLSGSDPEADSIDEIYEPNQSARI